MTKKRTTNNLMMQYALTGGALGLYFGLFFRPVRSPSAALVLGLALTVAVVMAVLRAFKERPSVSSLLKGAALNFVKTAVLLALLELRHPLYDMGGKTAVSLVMTLAGAAAGLWYARAQSRQPIQKKMEE
ncbi:MAG: hypothetical protein KBE23_02810 [Chloroflexi bacterium]|nr:hypothetical protein [Chloroflexota bacterium]MBP7041645.1 hypothetical protein [Chloroflexota bacterium]